MRGNEFLDKMELIDPAYVEAADATPKKKKRVCGSIYRDRCGYKRKYHYKAFPAYYGLG